MSKVFTRLLDKRDELLRLSQNLEVGKRVLGDCIASKGFDDDTFARLQSEQKDLWMPAQPFEGRALSEWMPRSTQALMQLSKQSKKSQESKQRFRRALLAGTTGALVGAAATFATLKGVKPNVGVMGHVEPAGPAGAAGPDVGPESPKPDQAEEKKEDNDDLQRRVLQQIGQDMAYRKQFGTNNREQIFKQIAAQIRDGSDIPPTIKTAIDAKIRVEAEKVAACDKTIGEQKTSIDELTGVVQQKDRAVAAIQTKFDELTRSIQQEGGEKDKQKTAWIEQKATLGAELAACSAEKEQLGIKHAEEVRELTAKHKEEILAMGARQEAKRRDEKQNIEAECKREKDELIHEHEVQSARWRASDVKQKEKITTLTEELEASTSSLNKKNDECSLLQQKQEANDETFRNLEAKIAEHLETIEGHVKTISKNEETIRINNSKIAELEGKVTNHEGVKNDLAEKNAENTRLEAEIARHTATIREKDEIISGNNGKIAELEEKVTTCENELQTSQVTVERLTTEQALLEKKLSERDVENNALKAKVGQDSTNIGEKDRTIAELNKQQRLLQTKLDECIANNSKAVTDYAANNAKHDEQITKLRGDYEAATAREAAKLSTLELRNKTLAENNISLNALIETDKSNIEKLTKEIQQKDAQIQTMTNQHEQEIKNLGQQITALGARIVQLIQEVESVNAKIGEAEQLIKLKDGQITEQQNSNLRQQDDLRQLQTKNNGLEAEITVLQRHVNLLSRYPDGIIAALTKLNILLDIPVDAAKDAAKDAGKDTVDSAVLKLNNLNSGLTQFVDNFGISNLVNIARKIARNDNSYESWKSLFNLINFDALEKRVGTLFMAVKEAHPTFEYHATDSVGDLIANVPVLIDVITKLDVDYMALKNKYDVMTHTFNDAPNLLRHLIQLKPNFSYDDLFKLIRNVRIPGISGADQPKMSDDITSEGVSGADQPKMSDDITIEGVAARIKELLERNKLLVNISEMKKEELATLFVQSASDQEALTNPFTLDDIKPFLNHVDMSKWITKIEVVEMEEKEQKEEDNTTNFDTIDMYVNVLKQLFPDLVACKTTDDCIAKWTDQNQKVVTQKFRDLKVLWSICEQTGQKRPWSTRKFKRVVAKSPIDAEKLPEDVGQLPMDAQKLPEGVGQLSTNTGDFIDPIIT